MKVFSASVFQHIGIGTISLCPTQGAHFHLSPSKSEQEAALVDALADVIWQSRTREEATLAIPWIEQGCDAKKIGYSQLMHSLIMVSAASKPGLQVCCVCLWALKTACARAVLFFMKMMLGCQSAHWALGASESSLAHFKAAIHFLHSSLQEHLRSCLSFFVSETGWGIVLLLISLLLTRGVEVVKGDMDEGNNPLSALHGYCTQELVNLILLGRL